jgi:hypothetical protein
MQAAAAAAEMARAPVTVQAALAVAALVVPLRALRVQMGQQTLLVAVVAVRAAVLAVMAVLAAPALLFFLCRPYSTLEPQPAHLP